LIVADMQIRLVRTSRVPSWSAPVVAFGLLWLVLAIAGTIVAWILHQHLGMSMTLCTFKTITGLPCLTCGATRCALCALEGRFIAAFAYNPLVFTGALVAGVLLLLRVVSGCTLRLDLRGRPRTVAWVLAIALVLANWAYLIGVRR